MRGPPVNAPTDELAAAWTINNGTDLEMGSTVWTNSMRTAVANGRACAFFLSEHAEGKRRMLGDGSEGYNIGKGSRVF